MGRRIFVVDLGLDRVFIYDRDDVGKGLRDTGKYLSFPAGAGPRHLAFHPRMSVIYAACELDNKLAVVREKEGEYVLESILPTLPESYRGENTAAAIRIWNGLLMVSNRGHDSIAVYSLKEDGGAALEQIVPTGGKIPRDFAVMGEYVAIANQGSDEITVLRMNPGTKLLEQTGISVPMSRPTCICPVSP
nr:beta-propeller fold lactonase family protein [uncultured Acetatifactor sp.]